MLLQKQFDMTPENGNMMRVVPLFETLTDLTNAPEVMDKLFSLPNYLDSVKQKHEVGVRDVHECRCHLLLYGLTKRKRRWMLPVGSKEITFIFVLPILTHFFIFLYIYLSMYVRI
jgi:hypothetical protein